MIKEYYRFKCWTNDFGQLVMQKLTLYEWNDLNMEDGYIVTFNGQRATVVMFTIEVDIDRNRKLKAAGAWMNGHYTTTEIDLNKCVGREITGTPH